MKKSSDFIGNINFDRGSCKDVTGASPLDSSGFSPVLGRNSDNLKRLHFTTASDIKPLHASTPAVFSPVLARSSEELNGLVSRLATPSEPTPLQPRNYSVLSTVFSPLCENDESLVVTKLPSNNVESKTKDVSTKIASSVVNGSNKKTLESSHHVNRHFDRVVLNSKDLSLEYCQLSKKPISNAYGSKNGHISQQTKIVDTSMQTENKVTDCPPSSACSSSSAFIQADFIRSIIESSLEEFEDRNRHDFQIFYSQFLWHMQAQSEKIDSLLKNFSTVEVLVKENEKLRKENEKLKLLRFGK